MNDPSLIVIGKLVGAHGLKGWLKVHSWADPDISIGDYSGWILDDNNEWEVLDLVRQGKRLTARLAGVDNRDAAEKLSGSLIRVARTSLPALPKDQFYWADLVGLSVSNMEGESFGEVKELLETGANDVLVVSGEKERLIPFVMNQTVLDVDLEKRTIRVDWDSDY